MLLAIAFVLILFISIGLSIFVVKKRIFVRLNFIASLINILLFVAGLYMVYNSTEDFARTNEMRSWTSINGVVLEGKVVGDRAKRPELIYSYEIDGVSYIGHSDLATPSFGGKNYRDQSSRAVVSKFEKGDSIQVFSNPNDPAQSILKISPKWSSFMQYGLGIIFLGLAFALFFSGLLERK